MLEFPSNPWSSFEIFDHVNADSEGMSLIIKFTQVPFALPLLCQKLGLQSELTGLYSGAQISNTEHATQFIC
jgi:hypothetical protein